MAFDINNFALTSGTANRAVPFTWAYETTDTYATVTASGYFNQMAAELYQYDLIYVNCSDEQAFISVTSASQAATVTTALFSTFTTGLAYGSILIGNASNIATAVDAKTSGNILVGNGTTLVSTDNILTAQQAGNYSNNSGTASQMLTFVATTAGGATANRDITSGYKVKVIGVHVIVRGTGTTSDTIQVFQGTGGSNPITEAISIASATATANNYLTSATLNDANSTIAASGVIRITETDGGGSDSPATTVLITCLRSA